MKTQEVPEGKYKWIVFRICIIAALGGLLFGLDQGFIANSLNALENHYGLDLVQGQEYAAILAYGGILGALLSGFISRFIGRKKALILSGLLFTVTTAISAILPPMEIMLILRFIIGFSVGLASFVVPLYLSETAPKDIRGAMGSLFQLMITIGIFMIAATNVTIVHIFVSTNITLPLMFLVITVFASIMFFGCLTLPESPRWLMLKGKHNQARNVLIKLRNTEQEVNEEYKDMEDNLKVKKHGFSILSRGYFWKILSVCVVLQCFQQLVGINMMIYYSPTIFGYAGMSGILAMMLVPVVNMIFTLPAIKWVEKWGRKKLLSVGAIIMCVAMASAGLAFYLMVGQSEPTLFEKGLLFIAVIVYIFGFACSWGPVAWILCSELFPQEGREIGMTASTMVNWTFSGLVTSSSLTVMHVFGNSSIFFIFAALCILAFFFVKFFIPETKGVPLEKIEADLKAGVKLSQIGK